jgi:hypothetical protein
MQFPFSYQDSIIIASRASKQRWIFMSNKFFSVLYFITFFSSFLLSIGLQNDTVKLNNLHKFKCFLFHSFPTFFYVSHRRCSILWVFLSRKLWFDWFYCFLKNFSESPFNLCANLSILRMTSSDFITIIQSNITFQRHDKCLTHCLSIRSTKMIIYFQAHEVFYFNCLNSKTSTLYHASNPLNDHARNRLLTHDYSS